MSLLIYLTLLLTLFDIANIVFTSSVNVCFNGHEILDGNEIDHKWLECKCFERRQQRRCENHHLDAYSKSKQDAEKLILSIPSSTLHDLHKTRLQRKEDGKIRTGLRTCILRYELSGNSKIKTHISCHDALGSKSILT